MADRIQLRRDSASGWAQANPVLADGELGFERETRRIKVGDGVTPWNDLDFFDSGDVTYEHEQHVASDTWVISHNLAKYPAVTIVDSSGDECEGGVNHVSVNQMIVTFSAAFSGRAFLN